jgi:hypothetical protein
MIPSPTLRRTSAQARGSQQLPAHAWRTQPRQPRINRKNMQFLGYLRKIYELTVEVELVPSVIQTVCAGHRASCRHCRSSTGGSANLFHVLANRHMAPVLHQKVPNVTCVSRRRHSMSNTGSGAPRCPSRRMQDFAQHLLIDQPGSIPRTKGTSSPPARSARKFSISLVSRA